MQTTHAVSAVRTSHAKYEAESPCRYAWIDLPDGRTVSLFVNIDTALIVVDVVDANEKGGIEILRRNV